MIDCGSTKGHTLHEKKILLYFPNKYWILISDYILWLTMQLVNMIQEHLGHKSSSVGVTDGQEVTTLGKFVHHYHYSCFSLGFWKSINKIHTNTGLGSVRNLQGL